MKLLGCPLLTYQTEQKWLQDLYNIFARESRRAEMAFSQCRVKDHEKDEVLDGFIYNSVMQSWFSSHGSILCCWFEKDRRVDHNQMAKCILCKVLSTSTGGVNQIFLYDHNESTEIDLPESYLRAKDAALKTKKDTQGVLDEETPNTKEIFLLSLAMQVKARGFSLPLEKIDFSGPTQLIDSLIFLLVEALHSMPGHVFLVLESPGRTESLFVVSETLNVVNGLLSKSRGRNLSHNCSVIMSVLETPNMLNRLKGYPSVRSDSEYQGMGSRHASLLGYKLDPFMT